MSYRDPPTPPPLVYVAFNGHVLAMNRETGDRVWQVDLECDGAVRLSVTADRVYALAKMKSFLVCIDASSGLLLWKAAVFGDTLLVDATYVFVGLAGVVSCISATSGKVLWKDRFQGMGSGDVAIAVNGMAAQADTHD